MPRLLCATILLSLLTLPLVAQEMTPADKADRVTAIALYEQNKFIQALPIFERLAASYPKDVAVMESYGMCLLSSESLAPTPEARKAIRTKALAALRQAKALGDNSNLLTILLEIPEDPGTSFSGNSVADASMKSAEADFSRGELQKAIEGYKIAFAADPKLYEAALFAGDANFKLNRFEEAGGWFTRAIAVNPDRETAYRYWGDTLVKAGYPEEARLKFIDALVAEPYTTRAQTGLTQFLDRYKTGLHAPKLKEGAAASVKDDKNIHITLDSSAPEGPESAGWLAYAMSRALWHGEKFKKEFPNEPQYRHTLKEEAESLSLLLSVIDESGEKKKNKKSEAKPLDPGLVDLLRIKQAGLLEPYILYFRADKDMIRDYIPYRAVHRAELRRYLDEFAVPKVPSGAKPAEAQ